MRAQAQGEGERGEGEEGEGGGWRREWCKRLSTFAMMRAGSNTR